MLLSENSQGLRGQPDLGLEGQQRDLEQMSRSEVQLPVCKMEVAPAS